MPGEMVSVFIFILYTIIKMCKNMLDALNIKLLSKLYEHDSAWIRWLVIDQIC